MLWRKRERGVGSAFIRCLYKMVVFLVATETCREPPIVPTRVPICPLLATLAIPPFRFSLKLFDN